MRAGLIGAVVATVVGTLANDSGALLLEVGTAYLLVFVGFAWAESGQSPQKKTKKLHFGYPNLDLSLAWRTWS